ncbi:alanine racemase [Halalkalibaculum sp. DA384]|uniref:alanine racemase n=1 Tax=Halalkalibaculum sp. DA384 TaxID=3373606 RepID=UPI003754B810
MISSPTLLIDPKKCKTNIRRMAEKAGNHGLAFKPHVKTHQSPVIGEWFREFGIDAITVSSVKMGHLFADHGWRDITVAFPVNIREIDSINTLAAKIDALSLLVANIESVQFLREHLTEPAQVYIEIDTGGERSGFRPGQTDSIARLIRFIKHSDLLTLKGFYSHPGHTYSARSKHEIKAIYADVVLQVQRLKNRFNNLTCCIGDTPGCTVADDFGEVDEISPGNFVFYDLMQAQAGACTIEDIAVALAAPVVATYPQRNECVIHGGAVHLSKETLEWDRQTIYGLPVLLEENNRWSQPVENAFIKNLSQEHGILKCSPPLMKKLHVGDIIGVLPVHSCLTANLMKSYYSLEGNDLIT